MSAVSLIVVEAIVSNLEFMSVQGLYMAYLIS